MLIKWVYWVNNMRKPLIGITAPNTNVSINMSSSQNVTLIANSYLNIVNDFDAVPVILPSFLNEEQIQAFITILDGLILTSGQDLSSTTYGVRSKVIYSKKFTGIGEPYKRPMLLAPDPKRDEVEIALYKAAKNKGIPIIGVCRGMQLINVAEGGTLFEELAESAISHYIDPDGWINYHSISIVPNTLSSKLLGVSSYFVSSIHHQGVEKIGNNLKISAFAEDGVIEIIEHEDETRFIIGFQGHVEKIRKNQSAYDCIFKAFFERSKKHIVKLVACEF